MLSTSSTYPARINSPGTLTPKQHAAQQQQKLKTFQALRIDMGEARDDMGTVQDDMGEARDDMGAGSG